MNRVKINALRIIPCLFKLLLNIVADILMLLSTDFTGCTYKIGIARFTEKTIEMLWFKPGSLLYGSFKKRFDKIFK